jgi:hypothetical protein
MGGRDYETWMGDALGAQSDANLLVQARESPSASRQDPRSRATHASLELARRTDRALALISAEGPILVEGRFAEDEAFGLALAQLRPAQPVYRSSLTDGVAVGALRLVSGRLFSAPALERIG